MQEVDGKSPYIGRYAPTPSGWLHKGHASTFGWAKKRADQVGGKIYLRIEDIDPARCRENYVDGILEDMTWLGLKWDNDPRSVKGWIRQSEQKQLYLDVLSKLHTAGWIYPCQLSRKEIRGHPETKTSPSGEILFPKVLRGGVNMERSSELNLYQNWRFAVPETDVVFRDLRLGEKRYLPGRDFSDFLVWGKNGFPSYELAVVVDDHLSAISEVVRGEDLLVSTARQLLIYAALEWNPPAFFHCPLVCDEQGKRLGKRFDSLSIRELRQQGLCPEAILEVDENL
jgi:glutamyl/glutaminyl-tRNA synthetase